MSCGLSRYRLLSFRCVTAIGLLLWPCITVGQDATTHSRFELGAAAGVSAVGGDAFARSKAGIGLSTYGAVHLGSGWTLRGVAGLSAALGNELTGAFPTELGPGAVFGDPGSGYLMFGAGPVYRFAPAAALVVPYLGGQFAYVKDMSDSDGTGWGGGVVGGLTFWMSNTIGVDSGVMANVIRCHSTRRGPDMSEERRAWGRVVNFTIGLVLALR
jgi:hypothetical protein